MKKTITIGIPAHNEEKNISSLIQQILSQKDQNFKIKKIIVACDGCTDKTLLILNDLKKKHKIIEVLNDGKRLGKNARLNAFYKNLASEIFIAFDADIQIKDKNTIKKILREFNTNKIGLVGGRVTPLMPNTFIGKLVYVHELFWREVIGAINEGNNIHSHTGPISAGTKGFLKNIKIPKNLPDDHYLYIKAIEMGYEYKYSKAEVYIKIPSIFFDYMKQSTRFLTSAETLRKHFKNVSQYYYIPYPVKLFAYIKTFMKYPIELPLSLLLVTVQKIYQVINTNAKNVAWSQVKSSK